MLVATDIAARGIDVEELGHVVNFDVPQAPDDYIHRVGRTGRADAVGEAFTFVSPQEENDLRDIESAINRRLPRVTVPDFDYTAKPEASSRCRSRNGSPRSARASAKSGLARKSTPPGAPRSSGIRAARARLQPRTAARIAPHAAAPRPVPAAAVRAKRRRLLCRSVCVRGCPSVRDYRFSRFFIAEPTRSAV